MSTPPATVPARPSRRELRAARERRALLRRRSEAGLAVGVLLLGVAVGGGSAAAHETLRQPRITALGAEPLVELGPGRGTVLWEPARAVATPPQRTTQPSAAQVATSQATPDAAPSGTEPAGRVTGTEPMLPRPAASRWVPLAPPTPAGPSTAHSTTGEPTTADLTPAAPAPAHPTASVPASDPEAAATHPAHPDGEAPTLPATAAVTPTGPERATGSDRDSLAAHHDALSQQLQGLQGVLLPELVESVTAQLASAEDILVHWPVTPVVAEQTAGELTATLLGRATREQPPTLSEVTSALAGLAAASQSLPTIETIDGATMVNGVLVANKTFALGESYDPGLLPEVQEAFTAMRDAAARDGLSLWIKSGYRSFVDQQIVYGSYVEDYGSEQADSFSARPGHSEHQSGLALDVNSTSADFAGTPEADWIAAHAAEFGFVVRYPQGKEAVTGYTYEPWHLRHVGTELATTLVSEGLTLEEYLGVTSRY